ncbi:MAG: NHLP bacteriocin system secretion protein [Paracoccaceae bacterium]
MQFREKALKKLSTPEELKVAVAVTSPLTWVLVSALLFGFAVLLAWGIKGTIQTRVLGPAFIVYQDTELTEVVALGSGTLTELYVDQGDIVEAGDVLASVSNPGLVGRLEHARLLADEAAQSIEDYKTMRDTELEEFDRLQGLQRAAMDSKLEHTKEMADAFESRLTGNEHLLERGFTNVASVDELRSQYFVARQEIESVKNDIAQLDLNREERVTNWRQRILDLERNHSELTVQVIELEDMVAETETIYAPVAGEVSPILVAQGAYLDAGRPVMSIIKPNAHLDTLAFINAGQAKLVTPGMGVRISPASYQQEEYGTVRGTVQDVSRFPLSSEALFAILQNQNLVNQFVQEGAPLLVRISMDRDESGDLIWTTANASDTELSAGTLASVSVTVREQAPITLLLPTLKSWVGVQ